MEQVEAGGGEGEDKKRRSEIQVLEDVTNVNRRLFFIRPWAKSESQRAFSSGLLTPSPLRHWPSLDASLVVIRSPALWLMLGAFVVFHYKSEESQNSIWFFSSASLCLSLIFRSASVGCTAEKSHLYHVWRQVHRCNRNVCGCAAVRPVMMSPPLKQRHVPWVRNRLSVI